MVSSYPTPSSATWNFMVWTPRPSPRRASAPPRGSTGLPGVPASTTIWDVCMRFSGRTCSSSVARSARISISMDICCTARRRSAAPPSARRRVLSVPRLRQCARSGERHGEVARGEAAGGEWMTPTSKLPRVGTTIFTIMSRRAAELGAINLGQGFPDYEMDARLAELIYEAMRAGHNQYAPMPGLAALREVIAERLQTRHGVSFDVEREITVTLGATEAIFSAVQALVGAGDEVIVFDPAYDSYEPAIELAGARCVHVPLEPPRFRHDWQRIAAACTARTRLIILNSPHNPGCSCVCLEDLTALAELARRFDLAVISDEVYEYIVFDGLRHHSVLAHPELRERSVAVYSFGKTLHATGLRVGYAVAPPALTSELRKVHQFN